jgi:hypothetical protein
MTLNGVRKWSVDREGNITTVLVVPTDSILADGSVRDEAKFTLVIEQTVEYLQRNGSLDGAEFVAAQ